MKKKILVLLCFPLTVFANVNSPYINVKASFFQHNELYHSENKLELNVVNKLNSISESGSSESYGNNRGEIKNVYSQNIKLKIIEKNENQTIVNVKFSHSWEDLNIKDLYHSCTLDKNIKFIESQKFSFPIKEGCKLDVLLFTKDLKINNITYQL